MSPLPRTPLPAALVLAAGFLPPAASAQAVRQGPFAGVRAFGEAAEGVTLSDTTPIGASPGGNLLGLVYDFRIHAAGVGVVESGVLGLQAPEIGGSFQAEGVAADLDGDGIDEFALVWPAAPGAQIWNGKLDLAAYALEGAGAVNRQLVKRGAFPAAIDPPHLSA